MILFLIYTVKVCLCSALFYAVYFIFFRKLTFFKWNRFYLLAALAASFIVPLLEMKIDTSSSALVNDFVPSWRIFEDVNAAQASDLPGRSVVNWLQIANLIYFIGIGALLTTFFFSLSDILKVYWQKAFSFIGSIRLVKGTGRITNCSFFDTIFVDPDERGSEDFKQIVEHERCHCQLMHTYDKFFMQIIRIVLWYNPVIYLYKRSLEEVHEFEADALLVRNDDKEKYVRLLLNISAAGGLSLVHYFSKYPLKERVQMIFKDKSSKFKKISYLLSLPVLCFTLVSFAMIDANESSAKTIPAKQQTKSAEPDNRNGEDVVFFSRNTKISNDGLETDEIRLNFGNTHIVGQMAKGAKMLYMIDGTAYEEDEVRMFTPEQIAKIKCPCKVRVLDRNDKALIRGIYGGIVELGGKK